MSTLHPTIAAAINPFITPPLRTKRVLSVSSFNDDDLYIYDADTLELVQHMSHASQAVRDARAMGYRVQAGQSWTKGLCGKFLGLWTKA